MRVPPQRLIVPNLRCTQFSTQQFQGKFGAGYLMDKLMNVDLMAPKDILLVSGKQTTSDAVCKRCHSYVGWKYLETDNENNVFKINKFVLEKGRMKTIDFYKED